MAFEAAPPPDISITQQLRDMRPNSDRLFAGAKWNSIKAIASRLSAWEKEYRTRKEKGGIRVWRFKK